MKERLLLGDWVKWGEITQIQFKLEIVWRDEVWVKEKLIKDLSIYKLYMN